MFEGKSQLNIIIAVILAILGIILIIQNIVQNQRLVSLGNWFLTNGIVINAVAQPATAPAGHVPTVSVNVYQIPDSTARYIPRIVYKYTVNGKEYQSNQLFYGGEPELSSSEIAPFMDKFRVGSAIPVYYNPSDPQQSYVILSKYRNYWGIVFGIILILLAFWVLNSDRIKITSQGIDITSETPSLTEMGPTVRTNSGGWVGRLY